MTKAYDKGITGLLLVDPYNDFLSNEGKAYARHQEVSESVNLLKHLKEIVDRARKVGIRVFYVPHHRSEPDDFDTWLYPNPNQVRAQKSQIFAKGSWGGEFHPDFQPHKGDVIIKEHWASSGFANTDLDHQLKMHGLQKIIVIGLLANTCIEATARFGSELGYHVTLVKDATAAYSKEAMHSAHEVNGPTFAHAILTTEELLAQL
ncbi:isochorismatase family cysteine hydrolase [Paenibacillus radicis (ex Gao et al. 2016)]|uniref:Isochorismatase n=1 Tax=Paenibacillus radicis (ex Gao et al. 2016) TaxID=1737354 RepID=A0A917H760_9BACL|nr:isochorismatase family cysteine hydrolase [Paenibacillus radicis (ex Gao et al. 2016)]GGG70267.1 isochorismatase [Paenibacillus radicis (ex Gao et al. 2016)]